MFILITRFSLFIPNSPAWLLSVNKDNEESINEYKRQLFDTSRLRFRLDFLRNITLPIIFQASKKHPILQILKYSVLLPDEFKKELLELGKEYPFLVLCEYNEEGKYPKADLDIASDYFNDLWAKDRDSIVGMTILDDDDCLSIDYFDRATPYLNKTFAKKAISFGLGINGVFDQENKLIKFSESYYPKVNIGLLRVGVYRHKTHKIVMPRMGSHGRADRTLPVLLDSREVSYFWSRHAYQDTKLGTSYAAIFDRILSREDSPLEQVREKFGEPLVQLLERN